MATPTITDAGDEYFNDGEAGIVITGTNFGAPQGSGSVRISPTDDVTDVNAVLQDPTSWAGTSITVTTIRGSLASNTNLYLFVTNGTAETNSSGYVVQFEPFYKTTTFSGTISNATGFSRNVLLLRDE